jgi:hypothetical protein
MSDLKKQDNYKVLLNLSKEINAKLAEIRLLKQQMNEVKKTISEYKKNGA